MELDNRSVVRLTVILVVLFVGLTHIKVAVAHVECYVELAYQFNKYQYSSIAQLVLPWGDAAETNPP